MKNVPSVIVNLGMSGDIDVDNGVVFRFRKTDEFKLYCNTNGNKLFVLSPTSKKTVETPDNIQVKKAILLFQKWSKWTHSRTDMCEFVEPKKMYRFGRVNSLCYYSDKFNKNGKKTGYMHEFDKPPLIKVDDKIRPSIIEISGSIRVTALGIEG